MIQVENKEKDIQLDTKDMKQLKEFMKFSENYIRGYIKAILFCSCKWGAYSYDEMPQNANTCEGVMALVLAHQDKTYSELIENRIAYLVDEMSELGIQSKSLGKETVVPTAMFLYVYKKSNKNSLSINGRMNDVAKKLWDVKCDSGWGLYVTSMKKYTNIGCTYWAIMGLREYESSPKEEFQEYLRSLFKYDGIYAFGRTIDDVNPRVPFLYSTSMMYIVYMMLDEEDKAIVGNKYNKVRAIDFIIQSFDNPFYIVESEAIYGVNLVGTTSVHTVNWNHITIHYSLLAISMAIEQGEIAMDTVQNIVKRLEKLIEESSERSDGRLYWSAPNMTLEKEGHGKQIFPTMHFVMGLSFLRDAVKGIIQKGENGKNG